MNVKKKPVRRVQKSSKNPNKKVVVKAKKKIEYPPQEVIVYDCVQHEKAVAVFKHETKWFYSQKLYKVYHPAFKETPDYSRWVMSLVKTLGPITEAEAQIVITPNPLVAA